VQPQGEGQTPSKESPAVPITEDQIKEKYLERAIRELNQLTHELQDCEECPRGSLMPVLGSGHPQADVMLLKHSPSVSEIEEGVAFYGRSGTAVMKSLKRLGIDPLVVYGTLCVKCPLSDPALASPTCISRLVREIAIVEPRCIVVMGEPALECLNDVQIPLAGAVEARLGEIQALTPTIDVIFTPDIDASLDAEGPKRDFWRAFRSVGEWYEDMPPY
jgi:uracil-DNA glycosylase